MYNIIADILQRNLESSRKQDDDIFLILFSVLIISDAYLLSARQGSFPPLLQHENSLSIGGYNSINLGGFALRKFPPIHFLTFSTVNWIKEVHT